MNIAQGKVPLWQQLQATAAVVLAVRSGASGTAAIDSVDSELRAGVQALAFHTWRNLGRAEALRAKLAPRPPPPMVDALLCVALALSWQVDDAPYDAFTLVNQAVEAAKHTAGTKGQANFINACLRRFLRERDALVAMTDSNPTARWNHPLWWIERIQRDYPNHWQDLLSEANRQAPMTLRVNVRQVSGAEYLQALSLSGLSAKLIAPQTILLDHAVPVRQLPGFESGAVSVQDAAAQMAAPLLTGNWLHGPLNRILDACAAPGGKTGHLLELSGAAVTALDIDPTRCQRISDNLRRLGQSAHVLTADAARPDAWWDGVPFDAILLDAPCTASGIVRRHPDVRWLRRASDVDQLARIQKQMLQTLWGLLRPGGRLLYCTCSLFRAEGDVQLQTFLAHNTDAVLLPSPGHLMPQNGAKTGTVPDNQTRDNDGFYYALLEKKMA
jgi:16S rRNA (cytosine967-C5)-methyltransferase